jgi:hypothetical protein
MQRFRFVVLSLAVCAMVAGCEHVTGPTPRVAPAPAPAPAEARTKFNSALIQETLDISAEEVAVLLKMADRMDRAIASGRFEWPEMSGHPLDGLTEKQIQELFAAAGMRVEDYLPKSP